MDIRLILQDGARNGSVAGDLLGLRYDALGGDSMRSMRRVAEPFALIVWSYDLARRTAKR